MAKRKSREEQWADEVFGPPSRVRFPSVRVEEEEPEEITEEPDEDHGPEAEAAAIEMNTLPTIPPHQLEWSVLRKQMESQFRAQIADDDPLEMMAYLFYLTNRGMYLECAGMMTKHLDSQLAEFHSKLNEACEQKRNETRAEVMQLMMTLRLQLREEQESLSKALGSKAQEWQDSIEEVKILAEQIVTAKQGSRLLTILIGMLVMAGALLAGLVLGRIGR